MDFISKVKISLNAFSIASLLRGYDSGSFDQEDNNCSENNLASFEYHILSVENVLLNILL